MPFPGGDELRPYGAIYDCVHRHRESNPEQHRRAWSLFPPGFGCDVCEEDEVVAALAVVAAEASQIDIFVAFDTLGRDVQTTPRLNPPG